MVPLEPRQKLMETLGKNGCYFLSIVHLAENVTKERIDAIEAFLIALSSGNVQQDCFVVAPWTILSRLSGVRWGMRKEAKDYPTKPGELEILRFERQDIGALVGHFVVGDGRGGVAWDPFGESRTVRDGVLVSKRVFYREA
jgi:hypothetical protein